MDTCLDLAPATPMAPRPCGTHRRARVLGIPRATSAGWRVSLAAPMAMAAGHRHNQIIFPPRMGPPSCSPPV